MEARRKAKAEKKQNTENIVKEDSAETQVNGHGDGEGATNGETPGGPSADPGTEGTAYRRVTSFLNIYRHTIYQIKAEYHSFLMMPVM